MCAALDRLMLIAALCALLALCACVQVSDDAPPHSSHHITTDQGEARDAEGDAQTYTPPGERPDMADASAAELTHTCDAAPDDGSVAPAPVEVALDALLRAIAVSYASAFCDALWSCPERMELAASLFYARHRDAAACTARLTAEIYEEDLAPIASAVAAGHITYDAMGGAACVAALESARDGVEGCAMWALLDEEREPLRGCLAALQGTLAAGERCAMSLACGEAHYCAGDSPCHGRCVSELAEPSPCEERCAPDTYCDSDSLQCVARAAAGETCQDTFSCTSGHYCDHQRAPSRCAPLRALGTPCQADWECSADYSAWCNAAPESSAHAGRCTARGSVTRGQPCSADELCVEGLICTFEGDSAWLVCAERRQTGERCMTTTQCAEGHHCDTMQQGDAPRCAPLVIPGGACREDWQCSLDGSARCNRPDAAQGGTCALLYSLGVDEPCEADALCVEPLRCARETHRCEAPAAAQPRGLLGESCGEEVLGLSWCAPGLTCAALVPTAPWGLLRGTCSPVAQTGQVCQLDLQCDAALFCEGSTPERGLGGLCSPQRHVEEACESSAQCASHRCDHRTRRCAEPRRCKYEP